MKSLLAKGQNETNLIFQLYKILHLNKDGQDNPCYLVDFICNEKLIRRLMRPIRAADENASEKFVDVSHIGKHFFQRK